MGNVSDASKKNEHNRPEPAAPRKAPPVTPASAAAMGPPGPPSPPPPAVPASGAAAAALNAMHAPTHGQAPAAYAPVAGEPAKPAEEPKPLTPVFSAMQPAPAVAPATSAPVTPAPLLSAVASAGKRKKKASATLVEPASQIVKPRYSQALVAWHDPSGAIGEQYRSLRSHLLAHYQDRPFSMVVTSAMDDEGKSVTCLNLAFSLADLRECRTVVVDCDFHKRTVGTLLGDASAAGLADVLRGEARPEEVVRATSLPNVSTIFAGRATSKDSPLASRPEMDEIVRWLKQRYDFVLFDTPPINMLTDAGVIGRFAGDALLVVRMNHTRREHARNALQRLRALGVNVVGCCLTRNKLFVPSALYRRA